MDLETFFKVADRLGVPVAILVVAGLFAWRVLVFLKPFIQTGAEKHIQLIDTLRENDNKSAVAIQALTSDGKEGHQKTHSKLESMHPLLQEVHLHIVPRPHDKTG